MITAISRNFNGNPNIVTMITSSSAVDITTSGFFTSTDSVAEVEALNNGVFETSDTDVWLILNSNGVGFYTYNSSTGAFVAVAGNSGLSSTLSSGNIFVGNASNIATGAAMSGDATIGNTGVLTIANQAVTAAKIANNTITFQNLSPFVMQSVSVSLSSAQIKSLYDTPVSLVAAPGSGNIIILNNIIWQISFNDQYTTGGSIAAQYGNTVHGGGAKASTAISNTTFNGVTQDQILSQDGSALNNSISSMNNAAIYLSNDTADFAVGAGTAVLTVNYFVIALS